MNIKIQISDELYKTLVASGKHIRGSIALVTPKEGNFSAYATSRGMRKDLLLIFSEYPIAIISLLYKFFTL